MLKLLSNDYVIDSHVNSFTGNSANVDIQNDNTVLWVVLITCITVIVGLIIYTALKNKK